MAIVEKRCSPGIWARTSDAQYGDHSQVEDLRRGVCNHRVGLARGKANIRLTWQSADSASRVTDRP